MVWQPEVEEIQRRHKLAEKMGGPEGIASQRRRGKLTIRERIDALVDPGSFEQFGKLQGIGEYGEDGNLKDFQPASRVRGLCKLNGRRVLVTGQDFTIRGGSASAPPSGGSDAGHGHPTPMEMRIPTVHLADGAGGSVNEVEHLGRTYIPDGPQFGPMTDILSIAPVASAIVGPAAGGLAPLPCLSHFSVIVDKVGQVFPGGPPVVKAALGYDIDKDDLGGAWVHTRISGVVDNEADTEEEAFDQIRQFLSYMPDNVWDLPPRMEIGDDPNRRDDSLLSAIPRNKKRRYDPYPILHSILDRDSFFEISPYYGSSLVTGLGRADGYPVGVMITNVNVLGASMDVAAAEKATRLIQLCDTFHLPMLCIWDAPGLLVGLDSEKQGIERAASRLFQSINDSRMPWISFLIRQVYGVQGAMQYRPNSHFYRRYAWPSGHWGSMHIEGGTTAAFRRVIESAPDPEAKRLELEAKFRVYDSPFRTAEATGLDIIDPRDSRPLLCEFMDMAQPILKTQLGQGAGPTYRP